MFLPANYEFLKQREAEERAAAALSANPREKSEHDKRAGNYACQAELMRSDLRDEAALPVGCDCG